MLGGVPRLIVAHSAGGRDLGFGVVMNRAPRGVFVFVWRDEEEDRWFDFNYGCHVRVRPKGIRLW